MNRMKLFVFLMVSMTCMGAGISSSRAALLQLSHDPLFLNQSVPPAIAVTLDDSGSMAYGWMGTGSNGNAFANPEQNLLYYNPNITYAPPINADGSQMPQIDPEKAPLNGYHGYGGYGKFSTVNLTNNYRPVRTLYYYSNGSWGRSWASNMSAATKNGQYTRAFYLTRGSNGHYTQHQLFGSDLDNFANWYSYYSTRMKLARAAISRSFAGFGPDFKVDWQLLNKNTRFSGLEKFESGHRSGFYSFLFGAPSDGGTPLRNAFVRAGKLFQDNEDSYKYESEEYAGPVSCQQNFHIAVSDGGWNGGFSSPSDFKKDHNSLTALPGDTGPFGDGAGRLYGGYDGTGEQKIFHHDYNNNLADIAFHYWVNDLMPDMHNNVKRYKKDYTNASGAGITFTGTDEWESDEFVWNPKNNPAYWQHVVTYNVGMGLEASLVVDHMEGEESCSNSTSADSKQAIYEGLRTGDCEWPPSNNENTTRIDDVWHSSINSRGEFFGANNPDALIRALNNVVNDILERLSRGSTSTVSSGVITNETMAFSPGFDSSDWSGNLIAREVDESGEFGAILWDAACVLTGDFCSASGSNVSKQLIRNIYTYDKTLGLTPFDTSMGSMLKTELSTRAADLISRTGVTVNDLINYVRGDQGKEIARGGTLRNRSSILADIIHGSPTVVRGPSEFYDDTRWPAGSPEASNPYVDFQAAHLNRSNVMYVGSNSGMLHAFDASSKTSTEELWAYMPSKAFNQIHRFPDPQFTHWSYVDNTPVTGDAFFNGSWHTTLVSGMRYGGQAYFALDVTNASSNVPDVLWEFTDEDDRDMGFTYGQATIARISSTGEWVALLPNGYNNSQPFSENLSDLDDSHVSASGHAVLYVVRLSDGQLLAKLDTFVGSVDTPNGMSTAVAVDSQFAPGGVDIGADFAYAGDLYGNLWRFDFSSSNPADWESSIQRIIKADNNLYRPITQQPRVVKLPAGVQSRERDVMVIFGTGKYIELKDRSIELSDDQYLVGVIDGLGSGKSDISISNSGFVGQSFSSVGLNARNLTANDVDLANPGVYGWKVMLPDPGERLANPLSLLGNKLVVAATVVTAGNDPCAPGGRSWISAVDPYTGGTSLEIGRALTHLGLVREVDSILINDLVVGRPPILESPGLQKIIIEGADGVQVVDIQSYTWRRRNWTNLLTE